ncbi:retrovirus-related pol polyprotein from transposon TNT 1-94 [Tanacetum coccineum]
MSTSKTYQQSLADAGSETRPPMLERGSYIPWASRFRRYLNRKRDNRKWLLKALDEGPYVFKIFTPEGSTIPRLQTAEDLEGDDLLLHDAEMEVMNMILLSIPNEIYNSVDACTSAKDMWKRVERLMRGTIQNKVDRETRFTNEFDQFVAEPGEALVSVYNRFAQLMNDLERNNMNFPTVTINTKFLNSLQPEWLKYVTQVRLAKQLTVDSFDDLFDYLQQFEKLVNASRAKKLEKSHDPLALVAHTGSSSRQTSSYYVTHPTSVVDYDDEYQQDDVHNNSEDPLVSAMLLLAKAITQNFSNPTNNRLRASSNTRNQAIIQGDRVNIQSRNSGNTGRNSRRAYVQEEVVEGMNAPKETGNVQRTLRTPSSGNTSTVQCYNCSGKGHYARNCPKPRVRDSKYFMEQMLLAKQDEAGVILTDEQNDFLFADASRMEEIEELSANICLMARIQPADHTSDDGPSYESAFISEVQSSSIDENNEPMYPTHTKIINSTIGDDQINSNIKFDSFKGNVNSGSVEKDTHVPDLCAVEKLARNAYQEAEKQRIFAQQVQTQNTHLTSQLEMYKERVRILENINKDNNYLNEFLEADERAKRYNKQAQSQLVRDRDIIRDLEKQRDKLDLDVKNYKRKNEELQKTHSILKRQMSEKEDTYHDTILDLEAKLKKNVDLILKLGNSLQGMFMLGPKPLSATEISLNVRDTEDTLDDASKSQQKVYEKINDPIAVANKQNCWTIDYAQINALYKDFVPQKELSAEQKYFPSSFIPSDKNSNATPSIPASMPKNQNLLVIISELKTRLANVEKGKSVNTKFDKTNGSQPLLCVTPLHKHVIQKKTDVQKSEENHVVSKPVTLQTSPVKQSRVNTNTNVIAPGMYKVVTTHESQTNKAKHNLSSTGMNVASSVRRPMNKDSHVKNSVLANSKKPAKKVAVYVRKNKQTDITFENVIPNKENVINVDVVKRLSKAKTCYVILNAKCLGHNLFSVGQFCHSDLEVAFRFKTCYVRNLEGDDLLTGGRESNLYTISISDMAASSPVCLMSKATSTKSWLWHRRLSHLNFGTINDLTRLDLVDGLPKFKYEKDHLCSACERGKSKKASHPLKLIPSDHSKLELLHMDLCGPMRVASINRKKYILVIVDDYSRYTWVYFLHSKDETPEIIKKFIAQAQLNYKAKVCKIRTDNGTEFKNATLKAHYEKLGIMQQFSTARTPQQNGVVERRNNHSWKLISTMLIFSRLPEYLWAEAVATACFTQNRSIIYTRHNRTPYELLHGRKPNVEYFHVFGSLCYPTNDRDDLGKMKPKADIGVFIGYSETSRGTRASTIHKSNSSGRIKDTPSKEDLDNLFGLMFEEYFEKKFSDTPINSAAQTTQIHEDSPSTSLIIVDEHEAPPIATTSDEHTSPISLSEADEFNQEDSAHFDGNSTMFPIKSSNLRKMSHLQWL